MTTRDEIIEWANGLVGRTLDCANGATLLIDDARWSTVPPYWLALSAYTLLDGPTALFLDADAHVGWAALLAQIDLPNGLNLVGNDRRIVADGTGVRVVLRLSV